MSELHLVATVFMAGLIVFVQIVHYPLMEKVGTDAFAAYELAHTVRTGWVVIPSMLAELAGAVWLALLPPDGVEPAWAWIGLGLLGVVWGSTVLLQAPAHRRLVHGFESGVHRRLVKTNWLRTGAWLARVPVALVLAA